MLTPVRRALISVSDKTGVEAFARALAARGAVILSTGGTAKALSAAGIKVTEVAAVTGFPEMLDGRVKTLHPKVHGGILARRDLPEHMAALDGAGIAPIDLVAVNLYPFRETIARPGCSLEDAIENIDIGGPDRGSRRPGRSARCRRRPARPCAQAGRAVQGCLHAPWGAGSSRGRPAFPGSR